MSYLNYVCNLLNLPNSITTTSTTNGVKTRTTHKRKSDIKISITTIRTSMVMIYLLFCTTISVTLTTFYIDTINKNYPDTLANHKAKQAFILSIIINIFCILYTLIKRYIILKTKESKPCNLNIYRRDLPSNLTPAHVRLLVEDGLIDRETLAATILDLIDRGYLALNSQNRSDFFSKRLYISITDKSHEDLFEYERYLISWFFDTNQISSEELHIKLNTSSKQPCEKFETFQGLVLVSFPINKYYKKHNPKIPRKTYAFLMMSLLITIFIIEHITSKLIFGICEFLPIFGLANMMFTSPTYLLNDAGAELRDNYLDLKKYLKDFSLIKEKTSEMIFLWNYYLSYSVALGIKGVANEEIKNFFGTEIYKGSIDDLEYIDGNLQYLIDETPNIIRQSEYLYSKR